MSLPTPNNPAESYTLQTLLATPFLRSPASSILGVQENLVPFDEPSWAYLEFGDAEEMRRPAANLLEHALLLEGIQHAENLAQFTAESEGGHAD